VEDIEKIGEFNRFIVEERFLKEAKNRIKNSD
jgi:hypothetical protein